MRGLWKIHHAIQTQEARKDFAALAQRAIAQGRQDLAEKYQPKEGAGWRTIDKNLAKLREALEKE